MYIHTLSAEKKENSMEKKDRRRKFAEGDNLVRISASVPESLLKKIQEQHPDVNISKFIRGAIEDKLK